MSHLTPLQRIENARKGVNPTAVCRLASGWVFLADMQYLRGYCILMADPLVESINALDGQGRSQFLSDITLVGDALLEVTEAYRINYAILGNSEPVLHAHIVPRYTDEPEEFRQGGPWSYPQAQIDSIRFDEDRDRELMEAIAGAIRKRM